MNKYDDTQEDETKLKKLVGERFAILRNARKITQDELAKMLGMSQSTITGIETGKFFPSTESIIKISRALEVEPKELLNLIEPEFDDPEKIAKILHSKINLIKENPYKLALAFDILQKLL